MSTIGITTTQNIDVEYDLASLGERILAYIIDALVLIVYVILLTTVFSLGNIFSDDMDKIEWVMFLLFMVPLFFYDLLSETLLNGQSLGKKALGIKVISLNGESPRLGQYLIRWLFRFVDFTFTSYCCGLIMVAASEKRQRLGDMIAGTTVIKTRPRTSMSQTLYIPTEEVAFEPTYPEVIQLTDKDMQLVKEVLINVQRTRNLELAEQTAARIEEVLNIQRKQPAFDFLYLLLTEYNRLASKL